MAHFGRLQLRQLISPVLLEAAHHGRDLDLGLGYLVLRLVHGGLGALRLVVHGRLVVRELVQASRELLQQPLLPQLLVAEHVELLLRSRASVYMLAAEQLEARHQWLGLSRGRRQGHAHARGGAQQGSQRQGACGIFLITCGNLHGLFASSGAFDRRRLHDLVVIVLRIGEFIALLLFGDGLIGLLLPATDVGGDHRVDDGRLGLRNPIEPLRLGLFRLLAHAAAV